MQSEIMDKRLIISALGILVCHSYFGIFQERITRGRYGNEINEEDGTVGERFTCTLTLVGVECAFNWLFAKALLIAQSQQMTDKTPRGYYALCAVSSLLSMVSSNLALRWVAYPVQVVAKSAKPIPIMILGVLIGRKSYPLRKYFYTLMIVVGVATFMYHDSENQHENESESSSFGQFLIIFSLFMNGVTGVIQDRIRSFGQPSAQYMMMSLNKWSCLILTIIILITGEWRQFLIFTSKYPELINDLFLLSSLGAFGQFFIFMMISNFGSLPCSIVTTVRKFFAVLFSLMVFGNSLTREQWFGTILVFIGLFADMLFKGKIEIKKKIN